MAYQGIKLKKSINGFWASKSIMKWLIKHDNEKDCIGGKMVVIPVTTT